MAESSRHIDFRPSASWEMLRFRAAMLQRLRRFLDERGFVEVETPVLSADAVVDVHLDPIPVAVFSDPRSCDNRRTMWLQTSPEFAMKRLLASGAERIYQVTKAFRAGESGKLHNPEFTIVEWYRVGDSMQAGMDLLAELAQAMLQVQTVDQLSYEAAFLQYIAINPHQSDAETLKAKSNQLGFQPPSSLSDNRDAWLNYLLAEVVEPNLGRERPVILYEYPATQAALARVRRVGASGAAIRSTYEVAERFELYYKGIELANGYHELLDPHVLRQRSSSANAARLADGRYVVPEESRLLAAMEHGLPASSGVALGFDRLVMLAAGASSLAEVMAFPIDRA